MWLSNTMSRESPPVWTILPPCSSIAGSITSLRSARKPFERPNVVQADQAAVANHVCIDDGDQLPPIWRFSCGVRCLGFRHSEPPKGSHRRGKRWETLTIYHRELRERERQLRGGGGPKLHCLPALQ